MEQSGREAVDMPPEVPNDVEREASLLEGFLEMPTITGVQCAADETDSMNLMVRHRLSDNNDEP